MNPKASNQEKQTVRSELVSKAKQDNHVERIVAEMSGKGGVGKSFVTGILPTGLTKRGYRAGIMDEDINEPSIAMLFGIPGHCVWSKMAFFLAKAVAEPRSCR